VTWLRRGASNSPVTMIPQHRLMSTWVVVQLRSAHARVWTRGYGPPGKPGHHPPGGLAARGPPGRRGGAKRRALTRPGPV